MTIPLIDLQAHHRPIRAELMAALTEVLDSGQFAGGPFVEQFEEAFARYCGCPFAVGVSSGTEALWLTLLGLGVGAGDEVVTVPYTFAATVEAIWMTGARPVLVDIVEGTCTMDPEQLRRALTPRTKAIIPVHLYGQPADMDAILAVADRHGVPAIEDACQAHGATYKGRKAGSLGLAGCFSFYPCKNLGALGDAGAVVTRSAELRDKLRVLRDHGQACKYQHDLIGWNGRMDGFQAAALLVKLRYLDAANQRRRLLAHHYDRLLADCPEIVRPQVADYAGHVYHLYVVRVPDRDSILAELKARGIHCGVHYPVPIHLQPAWLKLGYGPGSFPVAERCAGECLSLPLYPELSLAQVEAVADSLKQLVRHRRPASHALR